MRLCAIGTLTGFGILCPSLSGLGISSRVPYSSSSFNYILLGSLAINHQVEVEHDKLRHHSHQNLNLQHQNSND